MDPVQNENADFLDGESNRSVSPFVSRALLGCTDLELVDPGLSQCLIPPKPVPGPCYLLQKHVLLLTVDLLTGFSTPGILISLHLALYAQSDGCTL